MKRERDEFDPPAPSVWRYVAWITVAVVVWIGLFAMTSSTESAAAPRPVCVERSAAHAAKHGETRKQDSRTHVRMGQLPTCGLEEASSGYRPTKSFDGDRKRNRDKKSRYCRKRWFC